MASVTLAPAHSEGDRLCPRCGSPESLRAVVGFPAPELIRAAERGEIALGGCVVFFDEWPQWACGDCGLRF
jgi:hypothetical protein